MRCVNEKKGMGVKALVAGMMLAALSAMPTKAAVVAGGSVPLESYFIAIPSQGIDVASLTAIGAAGKLATIVITNNAPNSFTLSITFTNGGFLQQGLAAGAGAAGTYNAFTGAQYYLRGRNPLGTVVMGWAVPAAAGATACGGFAAASSCSPAAFGAQTAATVDYSVDIEASWAATTTLLAGFYSEKIVVSLAANM